MAAVDTKVAQFIFENAIIDYLDGKSRILVTHNIDLLQKAEKVLCLDSNAEIVFNGEFEKMRKSVDPFIRGVLKGKNTKNIIKLNNNKAQLYIFSRKKR